MRKIGLGADPPSREAWEEFLRRISEAYEEHDEERYTRVRGQELAQKEMQELAAKLATARDEALTAARAKSEFLANMSHEIRTPLNGVIGMNELLFMTELSPEQAEYARGAQSSAEALLTVLNDILDFSKIEAGKMELEAIEFDLRGVIEELGDILAVKAREKSLELVLTLDTDVPRFVIGDPARLRQILLNLTSNAIKFTDRGEVVVRGTLIGAAEGSAQVRLSVRDTGIGIPAERQSRLFQPFMQVDASTTRRFGGTGLGLAISQELVHRMGGQLEVNSEVDQGSEFSFVLELPRATSVLATITGDLECRPSRALIVDDNRTNRLLFAQLLESWGVTAVCEANGSGALELLEQEAGAGRAFDLALLDYQMPGMNGHQLAKLIKIDPRFMGVPLVLTSSSPTKRGQIEADLFAAILAKPIKQSVLHGVVARVLAGQQETPQSLARAGHGQVCFERPCRVLLVEDNVVNEKVAVRLLERVGLTVEVARNGRQAVDAFQDDRFDLILMDCQMPVLDGFDATREIRGLEGPGRRVPIVALTAGAFAGDRERCLAANMDDHLAKPIRVKDLHDTLEKHLGIKLRESPKAAG